jgi:excisionase family DNA binding protein
VTWYHECSGGNWATWEPGEVVSPGDVGRFDKERRFHHWATLKDYGVSFTVSKEAPIAPRYYASGKAFRVNAIAREQSGPGLSKIEAGVKLTAEREHACLLQLRDATESHINETAGILGQVRELLCSGKWDIDLVVVEKKIRAKSGFAAISQGAGQSLDIGTKGNLGLAEDREVVDAEIFLASGRNVTGFLLFEFRTRETPIFFPPIRIKHSLWGRLLPWRAEGPWLIDPAGLRYRVGSVPSDLSGLPLEARRYDPQISSLTASEIMKMPIWDLFELVTSLPDDEGSEGSVATIIRKGTQAIIQARPHTAGRAGSASTSDIPMLHVRFLTVAEVATIMRISKMTVYRLVHGGELDAVRVGRSFRIPEAAVNEYLRATYVGESRYR